MGVRGFTRRSRCHRKLEPEPAALPWDTLHADLAALEQDELPDNRQAQALLDQLGAGEGMARVAHEQGEQIELGRGRRDRHAGNDRPVGVEIKRQVAEWYPSSVRVG